MAFPSVAARNNSAATSAVTTHTVNLPSGITAGDRVVIIFTYAITGNTITFPGTWTPITNGAREEAAASSEGIITVYRDCDGSEGSTISVSSTQATRSTHVSLRIAAGTFDPAIAPEASNDSGTNADANPPNLVPTGGAKDYLWITCGGNSHALTYSAAPTNYSNLQTRQAAGTAAANSIIGTAERQLNAASEDPGSFTGADAAAEWVAVTIAIHPAAGGGATNLTVSDATHAHASDSIALTVLAQLAVTEATHTHAADAIALLANSTLAIQDATHAHVADGIALTTTTILSINDGAHEHVADSIALTVAASIAVNDAAHDHATDAIDLEVASYLAIADVAHEHAVDAIELTIEGTTNLAIAGATHDHIADAVTLTANSFLAVDDATHAHVVDEITVTTGDVISLTVQDATHAHATDTIAILSNNHLIVTDATHVHVADAVALVVSSYLIVADATHLHVADVVSFSSGVADVELTLPARSTNLTLAPRSTDLTLNTRKVSLTLEEE